MALETIRHVLNHKTSSGRPHPIPWQKLNVEDASAMFRYLSDHGSDQDVDQLTTRLSNTQFEGLSLEPLHPRYLYWLNARLQRDVPIDSLCTEWVGMIDRLGLDSGGDAGGPASDIVNRCQEVWRCVTSAGKFAHSLRLASALSLFRPSLVDKAYLGAVNSKLLSLDFDDLERAAHLLGRYAATDWTANLKRAWLRIEDEGRRGEETPLDEPLNPPVEAAAHAVGPALGACAAQDHHFLSFAAESLQVPGLEALYDRLKGVAQKYNQLVEVYKAAGLRGEEPDQALIQCILALREQIWDLQDNIDQTRRAHRERMSPAFLLWCALTEAQRYPVTIRQAAAWGLHLLCRGQYVDDDTRVTISQALHRASETDDFQERRVQLLPNRGILEVTGLLEVGLEWMTELVDNSPSVEGMAPYQELGRAVAFLTQMPDVMDALSQFPLRLMPLDLHKKLLGNYVRNGCGHALWTRYQPPKWEPGMKDGEAGKVQRRYLGLEDRSTPNSMGIYYRLLRHPVLWLPVVYHEFLHHGGPSGNPAEAIYNETDVLLRELIFTRDLIARLAPADDSELAAFERQLIEEMEAADVANLRYQLSWDLEDDGILEAINANVLETYGGPCNGQALDAHVQATIAIADTLISLENDTNPAKVHWHPEVQWPLLSQAPQARDFRKILERRAVRNHRVEPRDRDAILAEAERTAATKRWDVYRNRPGALDTLLSPRSGDLLEWEDIVRRIVRRFDFEVVDPDLFTVLHLLAVRNHGRSEPD